MQSLSVIKEKIEGTVLASPLRNCFPLWKGVRVFLCLAAAWFVCFSLFPEILEEIEYCVQETMIA